jgi:hypothetical protein
MSAASVAIALAIRSILDRDRTIEAADPPEPITTPFSKLFVLRGVVVCETYLHRAVRARRSCLALPNKVARSGVLFEGSNGGAP